jgi:hypothetical protein
VDLLETFSGKIVVGKGDIRPKYCGEEKEEEKEEEEKKKKKEEKR